MLSLFRKRAAPEPVPSRSVPAGRRIYAIGDVHGRLDLLNILLDEIEQDDARRGSAPAELIFLGDLIDRGPDSAGVIERVIGLCRSRRPARVLMGNHEEVFLHVLEGDLEALRFFTRVGGRETILSYGISETDYDRLDYPALSAIVREAVPESHLAFLRETEDVVEIGDYVFVHAGVRPGVRFADQRAADLRWIRSRFLQHEGDFGKMVVHGHSISAEPVVRSNRIGIDTGAFETGLLTALGLDGEERWFLTTGTDRHGPATGQIVQA